jgi:hypothetical protein
MMLGVNRCCTAAAGGTASWSAARLCYAACWSEWVAAESELGEGPLPGQRGNDIDSGRELVILSVAAAPLPPSTFVCSRKSPSASNAQMGTKGLLSGGHYGRNLYWFALQHVCGPAGGGAHKLQSSAQLCHPGVGAAAAQASCTFATEAPRRRLRALIPASLFQ